MNYKSLAQKKQLESQLSKVQAEHKSLKLEVALKKAEVILKEKSIVEIRKKIDSIKETKRGEMVITEHAQLRYIERVVGLNMDKLRSEIISNELKSIVSVHGDGSYSVKGITYVVKNNVIITIKKS